ncbi:3-hydroxyacyl-CoA dehydrogenase NAD-binding domain-containing protein [Capillimicrobium parvum]|uniref:3-hydroxyacyl-CoA dehydrogenase NAD-binding domain-containing protein n=1 Tax=Capillimicrobium parvum TaxID=2884022 RepID=UPI00216B65FB|nr:3-hydroxyacyl-CoA dehydrogenase NAD-binding domain-containing protein [Capillimicrobium parvum]
MSQVEEQGPTATPAARAEPAPRLAVIGAGAMGAGIAAVAVRAGLPTALCDVDAAALDRGVQRLRGSLERAVARGRLPGAEARAALERLAPTIDLAAAAAGAAVVLEAVPERLDLKREILARAAAAAPRAVLASNTSSLPIAALAAAVPAPERLVGLHFFNPPQAMALVELVRSARTDPRAAATARALAERMGKVVVEVADGPGFLVNRCARPYYLEALRIVEDGVAEPSQIDRICRLAGAFPMGPFELMDVVGLDVSLAVTESMWEQAHGEPRWRPSPIQVSMVAAGRLGRKAGGGFYPGEPAPPEPDAAPAVVGPSPPVITIAGGEPALLALRERARRAGIDVHRAPVAGMPLITTFERVPSGHDGPVLMSSVDTTLAARQVATACAFSLLEPAPEEGGLVELGVGPWTPRSAVRAATALFSALGYATEQVADAPGGVLGRIVAQIVNEASFAVDAGVASSEDVDLGMTVGLGHPRGPAVWGGLIGLARVTGVLDELGDVERDPRYRVAPGLRRRAWS